MTTDTSGRTCERDGLAANTSAKRARRALGPTDIVLTLVDSDRARLPDGTEFRGANCETDAARVLIGAGMSEHSVLAAVWQHGTPSYRCSLAYLARKRFSNETGTTRWSPHPKAILPPALAEWWAREQERHAAARAAKQGGK